MICTGVYVAEVPVGERRDDIRRMLVERRRGLLNEIQSRVRDVREVGSATNHHTTDLTETVEAEPGDDLVFALIQLKAEMLERESTRQFAISMRAPTDTVATVVKSSRRPGSARCHLQSVAGIANEHARTSSTASALYCCECRQGSVRDIDASSGEHQRLGAR
jgi:hypothetical protein